MAHQHHGEGGMSPEMQKLFADQQSNMARFQEQVDGRAKRNWSQGRVDGSDDGDLAFAIGADKDKGIVIIDYGKPVAWVGMPPTQAIELAQALIKHARSIATEPLRISIN